MYDLASSLEPHYYILFNLQEGFAMIFYFTIYSFLGWLLENSYSYFTKRIFLKEGFFWGPFKPMYGFAPVLLVYLITQSTHWAVILFLCFLVPTLVEYVSGVLLQSFFHRQWWDYSKHRIQLQGHICLSFSVCWIFLSLLCVYWIHPILVSLYASFTSVWTYVAPLVILYFFAELGLAIRRHLPERSTEKQPETT